MVEWLRSRRPMLLLHHTLDSYSDVQLPVDRSTWWESSRYWDAKMQRVPDHAFAAKMAESLRGTAVAIRSPLPAAVQPHMRAIAEARVRAQLRDLERAMRELPGLPAETIARMLDRSVPAADVDTVAAGKAVAAHQAEAVARKELLFERVRAERFPDRPSRKRCLFALEPVHDAMQHMAAMGFTGAGRTVLEIEPLDGARILRADSKLLNCNISPETEQAEIAERYWAGTDATDVGVEVLLDGPFRIHRIVSSP